jgi:hypothetical protein
MDILRLSEAPLEGSYGNRLEKVCRHVGITCDIGFDVLARGCLDHQHGSDHLLVFVQQGAADTHKYGMIMLTQPCAMSLPQAIAVLQTAGTIKGVDAKVQFKTSE